MATMSAIQPGSYGFPVTIRKRYDNYIGGEWVAPLSGQYFENVTPVTGQVFCEVARSEEADIDKALDAAHAAAPAWGKTAPAERAVMLNKIADRIEENLESLALAEAWDNGKPYLGTEAASWGHRLTEGGCHVTTIGKLHYRSHDDPTGYPDQRIPLHVVEGVGEAVVHHGVDQRGVPDPEPGPSTRQQVFIARLIETAWCRMA